MKNLLQVCAFGPRLYTLLFDAGGVPYSSNLFETFGSTTIALIDAAKTFCVASSPIVLPYLILRYDPWTIFGILKYTLMIYSAAFMCRTIGRFTNSDYRKFAKLVVEISNTNRPSLDLRNRLKLYDFEASVFAVSDYEAKKRDSKWFHLTDENNECEVLAEPLNSLRAMLAFWATHSFGRRMLYPGALWLLKSAIGTALIEARKKHLTSREAQRNIIKSEDGNYIDSFFWDRRNKSENGNTLVICFEGNAGFYEVGVAVTPNTLEYSVLGWNAPGFGESSGQPSPDQVLNAADGIMQFAIQKLGFPESQIVIYAWSIGGFPASWIAANYPNIKALILDASFDDIMPLALTRMPKFAQPVVSYAVRKYLNLPVAKQVDKYFGPIRLIRRWNEEIIIDDSKTDAESRRASNRANFLLLGLLKNRYPGLLRNKKDEDLVLTWLALDPQSRVLMFNSDEPVLPFDLDSLDHGKRSVLIQQLCNKHFIDFDASHNVPLDILYFNIPTAVKGSYRASFTGVGNVLGSGERKSSRDSIKTLSSISSTNSESSNKK